MDLELLRALKCKNGNVIKKLAKAKPGLFWGRSPQDNTTLHIASRSGNKSIVQEIIKIQPWFVYERNQRGETPLHIAAAAGDVNIVKLLFGKKKIDNELFGKKKIDNGISETPLDILRMQDNENKRPLHILRMQDNENNTPLHMAVRNRHLKVVQELIKLDAEPVFFVNKVGQSPLSIAIDASYSNIARWIIRNSPDSLNYEGSNKMTLLHSAVMRRNYDVTMEILKAKKDLLTEVDVKQRNALHYAAAAADEVKIIVALLTKEDVSLAYKRDCNGQTPIHLATKNGRLGVVKMLVNDYPDVIEVQDNNQRNILHLAAQHGHGDIVSFILKLPEKNDLLNTLDEDGNTPLHLAAMNFRHNVIDTLCREMKFNIMTTNHKHQTALEIARTSDVNATENKKYLTLEALKETYKYQALDPDDIIANEFLSGSGTSTTDDQGKIERAKKLAEVILMLTSIVAAFTFTAAFTIPEKYNYQRDPGQKDELFSTRIHFDKADGFMVFMSCIAMSSTSCLSAAILICLLFWRYSNHHEYFIKRLSTAVCLTIFGLISMAFAFTFGVFVVLSSNHTFPMRIVWTVSTLPLILFVFLPIYVSLATSSLGRKKGVFLVD